MAANFSRKSSAPLKSMESRVGVHSIPGGSWLEAGMEEYAGAGWGRDLDMPRPGGAGELGEVRLEAAAAAELEFAGAGRLESPEGLEQGIAAADQGVAGAGGSAAGAKDAPSHGLGHTESFLQGFAIDPFCIQLREDVEGFGKAMKIRRAGGHV